MIDDTWTTNKILKNNNTIGIWNTKLNNSIHESLERYCMILGYDFEFKQVLKKVDSTFS
jgi:hypothetical protein